jgi:hypothetical protein
VDVFEVIYRPGLEELETVTLAIRRALDQNLSPNEDQ